MFTSYCTRSRRAALFCGVWEVHQHLHSLRSPFYAPAPRSSMIRSVPRPLTPAHSDLRLHARPRSSLATLSSLPEVVAQQLWTRRRTLVVRRQKPKEHRCGSCQLRPKPRWRQRRRVVVDAVKIGLARKNAALQHVGPAIEEQRRLAAPEDLRRRRLQAWLWHKELGAVAKRAIAVLRRLRPLRDLRPVRISHRLRLPQAYVEAGCAGALRNRERFASGRGSRIIGTRTGHLGHRRKGCPKHVLVILRQVCCASSCSRDTPNVCLWRRPSWHTRKPCGSCSRRDVWRKWPRVVVTIIGLDVNVLSAEGVWRGSPRKNHGARPPRTRSGNSVSVRARKEVPTSARKENGPASQSSHIESRGRNCQT